MIQDIYPSKLHNEFVPAELTDEDRLFIFDKDGKMLLGKQEDQEKTQDQKGQVQQIRFPLGKDAGEGQKSVYLFSIDSDRYFLLLDNAGEQKEGFTYYSVREVRDLFTGKEVFAVFTAYHLWRWYSDNVFCGRCGDRLEPDTRERALRCPKCGNVVYPRLNPAVIVGVTKGDSLLITRYRTGYGHNALVAGFTEIGETLEETVAREVMEETGIKVKNIRYYKSQPWGMAQDILAGFYCDADGDGEIRMDQNELKFAQWVKREEIELQPNNLSLTNEMMKRFRDGEEV